MGPGTALLRRLFVVTTSLRLTVVLQCSSSFVHPFRRTSDAVEELAQKKERLEESNPPTSSQTGGWTPVQSIQIRESRGAPNGAHEGISWQVIRRVRGAGAHRCRIIEWVESKVPTCLDGAWSASWVYAVVALYCSQRLRRWCP